MKIPKADTLADKICRFMFKHNKRNYSEIALEMRLKGHTDDGTQKALKMMREDGQLEHDGRRYMLTAPMRKHYENIAPAPVLVGEIVPPAAAPEFRPIQPKNQFWNAYCREPIRTDFCAQTSGTGFAPFRGTSQ
jgi:hypothetical protein